MSVAAFRRALGPRIALGGALLVWACQHDSTAAFDDTNLPSTGPGSSGDGSGAAAGESSGSGGHSAGGGKATAGNSAGGKASAGSGAGGKAGAGGKGGGEAGKAGAATGGSAGQAGMAGKGGMGGMGGAVANGGAGMAGTGGTPIDPVPMTFETTDIDDADVQSCLQNMNFGSDDPLDPDGSNFCPIDTLISIPLAGVPDAALVSDASLTLTCTKPGGAIVVSYVNENWSELQVRWNNRPQAGTTIDNIMCDQTGDVTIDLTAAVKAWLAGDRKNFGIYLRAESADDTQFASSETANDAERPRLSVTYTLPVRRL